MFSLSLSYVAKSVQANSPAESGRLERYLPAANRATREGRGKETKKRRGGARAFRPPPLPPDGLPPVRKALFHQQHLADAGGAVVGVVDGDVAVARERQRAADVLRADGG